MPPPLDVDREQVRMLVMELGCTEAAKRTGIPLNTVLQWSSRGKWLAHTRQPVSLPKSMTPTTVIGVIKPADALANALAEDSCETRMSLSRSARKMARDAESADLAQAGDVLQVGKLAALTHGWADGSQTNVKIAIFGAGVDVGAIDI